MGKTIIDQRPFIKSAVQKGDYYEISRKNQTTGKMYRVLIERDLYLKFIKSQRDIKVLQISKLNRDQINFIAKNLLRTEIRN